MNVVVTLVPGATGKPPEVGEIVKLVVFADEKIGAPGDGWEVIAPDNTAWLPSGGVTVSTMSVRALPAEGNATKLELEALVHQPGPLVVGPLELRDQVTKAEVAVPYTALANTEVSAGTKPAEEPPWILPSVRFGGWNWVSLSVLLAVLLVVGYWLARFLWRRLRGAVDQNLTHTQRALNAIANLQKYARSNKPLQLEEWKKFSFELAGILRRYANENFQIDSSDLTDREFLHELRLHSTAAPYVNLLGTVLGTITEVRYGRKELDASVVPGLLLDSQKFVETTSLEPKESEDS